MVGTPCCPDPLEACDICQGRPILEVIMEGGHSCADTVPFCDANAAGCGGTCEDLLAWIGVPCCPPPEAEGVVETCDICQGVPVVDLILETGYSCADTIPFCDANVAACEATCEELQESIGASCCPGPVSSGGSVDSSEETVDTVESADSCDICQGRPIIDFILETGYSCADSVPFCVDSVAACGGTCEELQEMIGTPCCPPASDVLETGATDDHTTTASPTEQPTEQPIELEQPTEQPIQQQMEQPAAAEDDDGNFSGAVNGAKSKLTMFLVMTVSSLLC